LLCSRCLRCGLLGGRGLLRRLARAALIAALLNGRGGSALRLLSGGGRLRLRPLRGGRRRWPLLLYSWRLRRGLLRSRRLRRLAWTALFTMLLCSRCGRPLRLLSCWGCWRTGRLRSRRRLRVGRRGRWPLLWWALWRLAAFFGLLLCSRSGLRNDDRSAFALLCHRERRLRKRRHRHQRGPGEETRQTLRADAKDHSWCSWVKSSWRLLGRLQRFCVRAKIQLRRRVCDATPAQRQASKTVVLVICS
jgi:hypothetical protein